MFLVIFLLVLCGFGNWFSKLMEGHELRCLKQGCYFSVIIVDSTNTEYRCSVQLQMFYLYLYPSIKSCFSFLHKGLPYKKCLRPENWGLCWDGALLGSEGGPEDEDKLMSCLIIYVDATFESIINLFVCTANFRSPCFISWANTTGYTNVY